MSPEARSFTQAAYGAPAPVAEGVARAAGYAGGYAAGYAAGAREAARAAEAEAQRVRHERAETDTRRAAQHAESLAVLAAAARAAADRSAPVLAESERVLHAAALQLAAAVLGVELTDGPASVRAALTRVLTPEVEVHTVRLSPRDLDVVRASLSGEAVVADLPALTGVELVADPSLAPGDAVGEFDEGYLDARIVGALDRAQAVLAEAGADADAAGADASGAAGGFGPAGASGTLSGVRTA
ncbi:MAG TPA: FliH/SctL family protein [Cellulomonas sp.]